MTQRVVIAGGGFGGLYAARRLRKRMPPRSVRVTLVSDRNFLLYAPLLPAVVGGTVEPRHVVVPLRDELGDAELLLGEVTGADPAARELHVRSEHLGEQVLRYDQLIVSLGSVSRTLPIDGLTERAIGFKTLGDALGLRDHMIDCLEAAEVTDDPDERKAWLTFVFTGGGYTGVEGIAQLEDLAAEVIEIYPRCAREGMRWVLVEGEQRIMREVPQSLAAFTARELGARGIEIHTGVHVDAVGETDVHLTNGVVIPTHTLAWTAGITAAPAVAELGFPTDAHGRIVTDDHMRVPGFDGVWAIGDAAAVPDPANPGSPCPQTAQHAMRQGRHVADNVAAALGRGRAKPFTYKTMGMVVDLGRRQAVANILKLNLRGPPAFVIARGYHLAAMPGFGGRRVRLGLDWMLATAFRRDSSELGVREARPAPLGAAPP